MLWKLMLIFMKMGFVSFGGGYAMLPIIEEELTRNGWISAEQFAQAISIAGMAPGPVAVNIASIVGYQVAGFTGAILTTLSALLPSFIVIIFICLTYYHLQRLQVFDAAFYGLRPIITGLIVYAGLRYAQTSQLLQWNWQLLSGTILFLAALFALIKLKLHPFILILLCAIAGMLLYH